ncbi:duf227 domain-containing protein [Chaetomium strumarium]|uniref:Duf227 domain-containing protein n=1 Tax=Chaetomium strumarium TaxID=1170767 RepID=A0AAJ0GKX2_9PEZI|nr:duf227 domain-containing protein [Chaetomium strumarium]
MGSITAMAMPNTAEEVTLEWLRSIFNDATISSFTITQQRLFDSASKLYITLSYNDDNDNDNDSLNNNKPRHILLKGGFNPAMFAVLGYKDLLVRVFTREVDFFTHYVSSTLSLSPSPPHSSNRLHLPKVWWAAASADQAILAMEDLTRSGHAFGDPTRTYSAASCRRGVEQLAALHVSTWGWKADSGDGDGDGDGDEGEGEQGHPWLAVPMYDTTMRALLAMWDEQVLGEGRPPLPGVIRDDRGKTARALEAYFATRNPRFCSLLHGDPHSGNTYHPVNDETDVRFLDWQIVHVGSVFHDVAYFVVGMLAVEDRRKHEWEVVEHYLKALAECGGPAFGCDDPEVRIEYRKAQMTGLGWILTPYAMQKKERVMAMVERYAAAIVDHKTIELLLGEEDGA